MEEQEQDEKMKRMRRAAEKGARSTQEKNGRGMQLQRRAGPHYKNDASDVKGAIMTTWWPRRAVTAFVEGGKILEFFELRGNRTQTKSRTGGLLANLFLPQRTARVSYGQ